jgi:hypothetical protein
VSKLVPLQGEHLIQAADARNSQHLRRYIEKTERFTVFIRPPQAFHQQRQTGAVLPLHLTEINIQLNVLGKSCTALVPE